MPTDSPPVEVTLEPTFLVAAARRTVASADVGAFLDLAHGEVRDAVEAAGARVVGPAIAWYGHVPDATADVAAALPVAGLPLGPVTPAGGAPVAPVAPVEVLPLTGGRCLVTEHVGPHDGVGASWERLLALARRPRRRRTRRPLGGPPGRADDRAGPRAVAHAARPAARLSPPRG
ncbi:AraC family transcriptional regulator [Cellulomonas sp. 179-A 9B4 NHS]|uniref:AraC family transcriptional regulator n=1 Tax=Cellulomonas sp. 179-A 9B4 NHS TaxID=3142379 RepID=UPI00399F6214